MIRVKRRPPRRSKPSAGDKAGISAPVSLSMGSALFPDDSKDTTLLMQQGIDPGVTDLIKMLRQTER